MAAPELRLSVGLDLEHFRGEVRKAVNIAQSEFTAKLSLKFDRKKINDELTALQRAIKRRVYRIEIGGDLDEVPGRIERLRKNLQELDDTKIEINVTGKNSVSKREARKIRTGVYRSIMAEGGKILLPVGLQPLSDSAASKFKADVIRKLGSVTIDVKANLQSAAVRGGAKTQAEIDAEVARKLQVISAMGAARMAGGGVTEAARRSQLRSQLETGGFTVKQLNELAKQLGVTGVSKLAKAAKIEKIVTDASVEMVKKFLDPQAVMRNPDRSGIQRVLDTFARGLFQMLGMDPAQLAAQRRARLAPPAINWAAQVPPRLPPNIGPSASGRLLAGAPTPGRIGPASIAGLLPSSAASIVQRDQLKAVVDAIISRLASQARPAEAAGALSPYIGTIQDSFRRLFDAYGGVIEAQVRQVAAPFNIIEDFNARRLQDETRAFGRALAEALRQARREIDAARVRMARVTDLGVTTQTRLPGRQIAGLLPPAVGRAPARYDLSAAGDIEARIQARIQQAYLRSAERGAAVMAEGGGMGMLPPGGPLGGGRRGAGRGGFAFPQINLPGSGFVQEIGREFGEATKQVLLFGTAYKALAAVTALPGNIINATASLQSFRNQLEAVTGGGEAMSNGLELIESTISKFNMPIDSARQGFVRLYASMAPAGISTETINNLFTGLAAASTTLGMSSDQVDRMTYALSQMASKGQITSEELKGQLGDVFPQAVSLFAKAAGFLNDTMDEQAKAKGIAAFIKALEDGALRGEAMQKVLGNVGILLNRDFGKTGEKAAASFQGQINALGNAVKSLYESFAPFAGQFLQAVVTPVTEGLKTVADGIKAFASGEAAETAGGFAIAKQLEALRPTFEGIRDNVINLLPVFQSFGNTLLQVSVVLLQIAGNPIVGYLAKIYAIMLPLNIALNIMRGLWAANALQLLVFNARIVSGTSTLTAFRGMMAATGATANTTAAAIRGAGLTLRTFFATTGVGVVVAGISILIERFMSMNQALEETRNRAIGAAQAIRSMTATEAREEERRSTRAIRLLEALKTRRRTYEGSTDVSLSASEASLLESMGVPVRKGLGGGRYMDPAQLEGYKQRLETVNLAESKARQKQLRYEERQTATSIVPTSVDLAGANGRGRASGAGREPRKYVSDTAKLLQQEMEQRINAIRQNAFISDREREIQAAALQYQYELLMNKVEYQAAVADENKKDILNRQQYLADLEKMLKAENELSRQRFEDVVTKPLRDILDEDRRAIIELEGSAKALAEGRRELTNVEQREIQIKQELIGLDEEQIQVLKPLIDLVLQGAKARDIATEADKRAREEAEKLAQIQKQAKERVDSLRDEIAALRIINDDERRLFELRKKYGEEKGLEIFNLEKIRDNIAEARALISDFVSQTSSDYKGFLKAVISGEDAADALKQFQEGLKDRVLTIFLDFAMKPVENFMQESLKKLFINPAAEAAKRPEEKSQDQNIARIATAVEQIKQDVNRIANGEVTPSSETPGKAPGAQPGTGSPGSVPSGEEEVNKFQESLQKAVAGIGIAAGSIMGIAAGVSQIKEGGAANVLGGIGSILLGIGGGIGGFANLFKAANGAVWKGGFQAFANGGVVNGPTLGLVGEGRYNEAIVPLPDGRSIPVKMEGESIRDKMGVTMANNPLTPLLSMSFQSTVINGTEYVDRAQLEEAMAETRRIATREGASRGASLAIDRLANSPSSRRKVGIR